jgi:hypothetical protein
LAVGVVLAVAVALSVVSPASAGKKVALAISRIYIEYNHSANDLGFHVFLDGEDWKTIKIISPTGRTVFEVEGKGGFGDLGMTELFFEGAEPSLDEVPLADLLALFPEGKYKFVGRTVDGNEITGTGTLTHKVPEAPVIVSPPEGAEVDASQPVVIDWEPVADPQGSKIVGYQVIVEGFNITLPASKTSVTVPPEFLEPGRKYLWEVLAIEAGGNQTIRESSFTTK